MAKKDINLLDPDTFSDFKKYVPWQEKAFHLVPTAVLLALLGLVLAYPQPLGVTLGAIGVVGTACFFLLRNLFRKVRQAPDFETIYGSLVWVNGLDVTEQEVGRAQAHFLNKLTAEKRASAGQIKQLYRGMKIEIVEKPIKFGPKKERLANGLAFPWNKAFQVRKLGKFSRDDAFYHEQMHLVQELIWGYTDYNHDLYPADWKLVSEMRRTS